MASLLARPLLQHIRPRIPPRIGFQGAFSTYIAQYAPMTQRATGCNVLGRVSQANAFYTSRSRLSQSKLNTDNAFKVPGWKSVVWEYVWACSDREWHRTPRWCRPIILITSYLTGLGTVWSFFFGMKKDKKKADSPWDDPPEAVTMT